MPKLKKTKIEEVLKAHKKWLRNKNKRVQASFSCKELDYHDMVGAYLDYAQLRGADLASAKLLDGTPAELNVPKEFTFLFRGKWRQYIDCVCVVYKKYNKNNLL